jgi:hypothetical protein
VHGKVLLVASSQAQQVVAIGGHIELAGSIPNKPGFAKHAKEKGFDVELIGERPPQRYPALALTIAPRFLDIHRITESPKHYWIDLLGSPEKRDP